MLLPIKSLQFWCFWSWNFPLVLGLQQVQDNKSDRKRERERKQTPGELVKMESYRYVGMIKRPAHNVKLIIKGPWANTSLQALLNTYEGEFLHSLSGKEIYAIGE